MLIEINMITLSRTHSLDADEHKFEFPLCHQFLWRDSPREPTEKIYKRWSFLTSHHLDSEKNVFFNLIVSCSINKHGEYKKVN